VKSGQSVLEDLGRLGIDRPLRAAEVLAAPDSRAAERCADKRRWRRLLRARVTHPDDAARFFVCKVAADGPKVTVVRSPGSIQKLTTCRRELLEATRVRLETQNEPSLADQEKVVTDRPVADPP
jgi:hypothetical protein